MEIIGLFHAKKRVGFHKQKTRHAPERIYTHVFCSKPQNMNRSDRETDI